MYDETVLTIKLTADEIDILKLALDRYQDTIISVGEELTVKELIEKITE